MSTSQHMESVVESLRKERKSRRNSPGMSVAFDSFLQAWGLGLQDACSCSCARSGLAVLEDVFTLRLEIVLHELVLSWWDS